MEKAKRYILTTRPLPKAIIEDAAAKNIVIEELSFIDTTPVASEAVVQRIKELASQACAVVFTSMNAVEMVATHIKEVKEWTVYCIGNTTKKLINEKLPSAVIAVTAENAERLAEHIVDDKVKKAVFFCGNIRRDELPNKIRSEGGSVEEIVVYETVERPSALSKEYEGILFFSPSAVNSFFKINKVPSRTQLFAIGSTTAETLRQFANRKIIVANSSGKQELAQQAIEYFHHQNP